MYIDAHLHLKDYIDYCKQFYGESGTLHFTSPCRYCFSAHNYAEFIEQYTILHTEISKITKNFPLLSQSFFSFGIHPQLPTFSEAENLIALLEKKQIHAIGECGFDLFTEEYRQTLSQQYRVWELQLNLARQFNVPLVIHCRKGLHLIFKYTPILKQVPAVIFHGWSGSVQEAAAFLKKGVNAYFSLGKAILRGQKSVCAAAASIDIHRILTETDAPYMKLKHEALTHPFDIIAVVEKCAALRGISVSTQVYNTENTEYTAFLDILNNNFSHAFAAA